MEVFSLLKFWRNAAGETVTGDFDVRNRPPETDDEDSFFDLVLAGPDCEFQGVVLKNKSNISSTSVDIKSYDNDSDKQLHHRNNTNKLSKRDGETKSIPYNSDSFSIRKILPIETNSKPQSPISLLRSPPKFRVFMFGFKKSSSLDKTESDSNNSTSSMATPKREQRFGMGYRVDEFPIATFLGRDNSLRSKMQRESFEDSSPANEAVKKDIGVYKYLKMIKPLYVRASNIRIFEQSTTVTPLSSPATVSVYSPRKQTEEKQGSRVFFREAYRNLVKTRWASSPVGTVPAPATRRDDSALQQQDGIQSAILHCKRSYSSSSSSSAISQECTMLLRSASDSSSVQRAFNPPRRSAEEEKRSSI